MKDDAVISAVQHWVKSFVVELNLCPFARRELINNRIRFTSTTAQTEKALLVALQNELELLNRSPAIETTLLIHANVLQDFTEYNQFLDYTDDLLRQTGLEGIYQIASFHPLYQFDGSNAEDAENYTNRSPYPLLHIIREASVERAIAESTNVDQIPARNIALMNKLGRERLCALMSACLEDDARID